MNNGIQWIRDHHALLSWLAATSALMFVASIVCVSIVVTRIEEDYFTHARRPRYVGADQHFVIRGVLILAKNVAGVLLFAAGLAMLVLPGQGLLSIFVGIMLMDFPGKFHLERWLIRRPPVLRSINWLRRRANQKLLIVDE